MHRVSVPTLPVLLAVLHAVLFAGGPRPVAAANAVVGTGSPASCTEPALDAAVATANSGGGTISFACGAAPHVIVLTTEKLLGNGVTVDGGGLITLSGGLATRIIRLADPSSVTLRDLVLTHGNASPGGAIWAPGSTPGAIQLLLDGVTVQLSQSGSWGGGIAGNNLTLVLDGSHVRDNQAVGGGGGINLNPGTLVAIAHSSLVGNRAGDDGGAVEAWFSSLGLGDARLEHNEAGTDGSGFGGALALRGAFFTDIERTRIWGNRATEAGGIYAWDGADLDLVDCLIGNNSADGGGGGGLGIDFGATVRVRTSTFAHNSAVGGGGIFNLGTLELGNVTLSANGALFGAGLQNGGTATLTHVTIADNRSRDPGAGVHNTTGAVLELRNSLLAANRSGWGTTDSQCAFDSPPTVLLFSLWSDTSCGTSTGNGNQPSTDPQLAALAHTCTDLAGERTPTHALAGSSAAIDAATCLGSAFEVDQRGVTRPQGLACDIGAVEWRSDDCFPLFADDLEIGSVARWSLSAP